MPTGPNYRAGHGGTPRWQRVLQKFFASLAVELVIGALIIASVGLTLLEIVLEGEHRTEHPQLDRLNLMLTALFAVELLLRFAAHPVKKRFFREYWVDILAILPLLRVFRTFRALRLLRLLRLFRLFGLAHRLASHFPSIIRRGATEYMVVGGLLAMTVLFGSGAMLALEGAARNDQIDTFGEAFWFSLYSLFAGEPVAGAPQTTGGRLVTALIMFMGLTIFAMFTGTVSAFMVDRIQAEENRVDWRQFENHVIICGWSSKGEIVAREYRVSKQHNDQPIVVVAQTTDQTPPVSPDLRDDVRFLNDDFTRVIALEQAGIHRARTCVILSDTRGGRSVQDADARTILTALTVEKLNPEVYTCAELNNRAYGTHLTMGHVNDYVVSGEHSAYLLAQASLHRGLMGVFSELLTHARGNNFYCCDVPQDWVGRSFDQLYIHLRQQHQAILVAVHSPSTQQYRVNPRDHVLAATEQIIVIAEKELKL